MNRILNFLRALETDAELRERVEATSGDVDQMLRVATRARYALEAEDLRRASHEATSRLASRDVWTSHPLVHVA